MSKSEYSILIRTDSYTGNTDSLLLASLFGISDDRYGAKKGLEIFKKFFGEHADKFIDVVAYRPVDDYGMMPYRINNDFHDKYHTLEVFIDEYGVNQLPDLVELWKQAFNGVLTTHEGDMAEYPLDKYDIKLNSFHLKEYVVEEVITDI